MVATGLYLLRLHQRKGALPGLAWLAPCALSGCPLRPATARPGSPDRAGPLTGALLPPPPPRPCRHRHDTAKDKGHLRMWPMPFGCTTGDAATITC